MIGITSYGAYVPLHRLGLETKGWGFPFEKAVGYYDEDSLTIAVAASLDCLKGTAWMQKTMELRAKYSA